MLGLAACSQPDITPYQLKYKFTDGGVYRVDARYTLDHQLRKMHDNRVFSDKQEGLLVKTSFELRIEQKKTDLLQASYTIRNISIHDQAGNFRLELGPDNGRIFWYGQEESVEEYLGRQGFRQYHQHMSRPLAIFKITPLGVQVSDSDATRENFNYTFIQLLGKNRVLGQIIMKSMKIPPVLMTIFSEEPVTKGKKWMYQGPYTRRFTEWDKPMTTVFQITAVEQDGLTVVFASELKFSGEELTSLGKQFGLKEFEKVEFESSWFTVDGRVQYQPDKGRPESGSLLIQKQYGMTTREEKWELIEKETYEFTLTLEPALEKQGTPQ
ncbi:hypothetical protein KAR34_13915 [bacterium]|nr:hypothetical protein [bacterium]